MRRALAFPVAGTGGFVRYRFGCNAARSWHAKALFLPQNHISRLASASFSSEREGEVNAEERKKVIKDIKQQQRANARRKRGAVVKKKTEGEADGKSCGERKEEEELNKLQEAVKDGDIDACVALGNHLIQKDGRTKGDVFRAIYLYEGAAGTVTEKRHPDAMYNLGKIFYEGLAPYITPDPPKGVGYFAQAAELGDASALYFLGYLYHTGDDPAGITRNPEKALSMLQAAADGNHPGALYYLSMLYLNADDDLLAVQDEEKALSLLNQACNLGNEEAWYCKGTLAYEGGEYDEAARCFEEAGKLGSEMGWLNLGVLQYQKRNFKEAFGAYEKAAELGSLEAMKNLASMHAAGEGTPAHLDTAKYLLDFVKQQEEKRRKKESEEAAGTSES